MLTQLKVVFRILCASLIMSILEVYSSNQYHISKRENLGKDPRLVEQFMVQMFSEWNNKSKCESTCSFPVHFMHEISVDPAR